MNTDKGGDVRSTIGTDALKKNWLEPMDWLEPVVALFL